MENKLISMNGDYFNKRKIFISVNWYINESEKGRKILYGNNDIESAYEVLNKINNRLKIEGEKFTFQELKASTMNVEQLKKEYKNAVINALIKQKKIDETFNYLGYNFDVITEEFDSICKN